VNVVILVANKYIVRRTELDDEENVNDKSQEIEVVTPTQI